MPERTVQIRKFLEKMVEDLRNEADGYEALLKALPETIDVRADKILFDCLRKDNRFMGRM